MEDRISVAAQRAVLASVAPGTPLRDGLERILRGRTGALIVLGFDQAVDDLCDGGFRLDVEFSSTRLRELCKMDGAVVLNDDATRILRANVQLTPDSTIPTVESGTRHRTAERTGLQTGHPVIAVSHSMSIISLYYGGRRHVVADTADHPRAGPTRRWPRCSVTSLGSTRWPGRCPRWRSRTSPPSATR